MQRIFSFLLLLFLPLAALADGMVIPTVAYPAKITIPDQRALICYTNGTERLVIETRFTGAGTNFAWVVPLPGQPVIEEATTGLFPTLHYLFRPEIVHNVPRYYAGILSLIGIGYLLLFVRPSGRLKWTDVLACLCVGVAAAMSSDGDTFKWVAFFFVVAILSFDVVLIRLAHRSAFVVFRWTFLVSFCLCGLLLPAGVTAGIKATPAASTETVSILDRKLVGVFESVTIASKDTKALQTWLSDNGYSMPTNAESAIASYVKDGWVFVATKIRRENAASDTDTLHPLSFTFKTDKPVYPMRLTGLNSKSLDVDLYVFGNTSATAPHFNVDSSRRRGLFHPLLRQWFGDSAIVTKLTATLSPADMSEDVRVNLSPIYSEQANRLYSQQGAMTTALNWSTYVFAISLLVVCGLALASTTYRPKLLWLIGIVALGSIVFFGLAYMSLPKIEVKLVRGHFRNMFKMEQIALRLALGDSDWKTTAEVRTGLQQTISNPTNAANYGLKNWDNYFVGGQFREEDSPGNYLLRETNNQVQLVFFNPDGGEEIADTWDLPVQHQTP